MMFWLLLAGFGISFCTSVGVFMFVEQLLHRTFSLYRTITWVCFSAVNAIFLCYFGFKRVPSILIYSLFFALLIIQFAILYRVKLALIFSGAALFVFHFLCARACATSILSLAFEVSLSVVVKDAVFSVWSLLLAALILLLITLAYTSSKFVKLYDALCETKTQLVMICTVEAVLLIYQFVSSFSYSIVVYDTWFTLFHLSSALMCIVAHFVLVYNLTSHSRWLTENFKTTILSMRINRQLIHYDSYEKHIKGFRDFREEYDKLIGDMRHNIIKGNTLAAQELLQRADRNVQNIISGHTKFSNNMLVDSILWDTACVAQKQGIRFEANVSMPSWVALTEIELCCLLINLCSNAVEGAALSANEKQISIIGGGQENWFTLTTQNSYSGKIIRSNGNLLTTKPDKELHGMGVKSIIEIINAHKGFYDITNDSNTFVFTVHIPKLDI